MRKAFRRLAVLLFAACIIFALSSCEDMLQSGSISENCEHVDSDGDGKCDKCAITHDHTMVETVAKAASCTTAGNKAYFTCSECNNLYLDAEGKTPTTLEATVIAALGHDLVDVEEKAATCTEDGYTAHKDCSRCDYIEDKEVISASHTGGTEIRNQKAATDTEDGYTGDTYCLGCEEKIADGEVIPALSHTHTMVSTAANAASCTVDGNVAYYTCSGCQKVFLDEAGEEETTLADVVIDALDHDLKDVEGKEATCTEDG